MGRRGRPGLTGPEKKELWERWKRGESASDIASALTSSLDPVRGVLRENGGIAPAERKRSTPRASLRART